MRGYKTQKVYIATPLESRIIPHIQTILKSNDVKPQFEYGTVITHKLIDSKITIFKNQIRIFAGLSCLQMLLEATERE